MVNGAQVALLERRNLSCTQHCVSCAYGFCNALCTASVSGHGSDESKREAALPGQQPHIVSESQNHTAPTDPAAGTCSSLLCCILPCHDLTDLVQATA